VEHVLLVALGGDEAVDLHLLRLPDAVAARLRLDVVLRVPVAAVRVSRARFGSHARVCV
jgi:hypothetical protein